MEKKITSPVAAGIIVSLILIVYSIVTYFTGVYLQSWNQYVGFVILVGGIGWSVINNGNEKKHEVSFGNLFSFGFKVAAVIACMLIIYTVLSGYIFPDIKQKIIEMAKQKALERGGATEEQIDKRMQMFENHYTLFLVIGIVFWYLLLGVITSLIAAAVAKKNPPSPFETKP